ncbi:MAG TPA: M50 family metallopeptidase [Bacillota bacterium]|nr:M50 family metallopeptidase [Bacillota bacterium]
MGSFINSIWMMVLTLSILVVVHEFGHFIMARLFGVTVHEFSVGFGPLIGKINRNGIQYSFRWMLLGGFVKIAGLDIALEGENPESETESAKIVPFHSIAYWKRVLIIAAGPVFNVIFGVILAFILAALIGLPAKMKNDAPIVMLASPGSPAFEAGIRPGDRIRAINDQPIQKWLDIPAVIQKYGKNRLKVELERKQERVTKYIVPLYNKFEKRYIIGIEGVSTLQTIPPGKAVQFAVSQPWAFSKAIVTTIKMVIMREVKGSFMGPVGMTVVMEQYSHLPLNQILFQIFYLAIQINMFLFLFNMLPLPLPLLDGGWIVIMTLEKLFRKEFSVEQKAAAQMVGMAGVLVLGAIIFYSDVMMTIKRFFGG